MWDLIILSQTGSFNYLRRYLLSIRQLYTKSEGLGECIGDMLNSQEINQQGFHFKLHREILIAQI